MKISLWLLLYLLPLSLFALPQVDSRDLAMGGVVISSCNIESAVFINPAVLSQSEGLRTSFTQTRLTTSEFDFSIGASFPVLKKELGVGFGWNAVAARNQLLTGFVRDSNGQYVIDPNTGMPQTQVLGFFTQNTNQFYLSAGVQFSFFSLGASLKYFLSDFGSVEGTGIGCDIALRAQLSRDLLLGATLFDLGDSHVYFNSGTPSQTVPMTLASSLSWAFLRSDEFSVMAEPGLSKEVWGGPDIAWAGGLEGDWRQNVFVRVGANQDRLSLGVGLAAHPGKIFQEIRVDYAYLDRSPDGYPSRLTLSVAW